MISRPCSAASRTYFSLSSAWPGGGSSRLGAGWPIFLWKTSSPAGIAICSRWASVSKRKRWGMSRGSQMNPPGSITAVSSPHVHVTRPSSRYQPSSSLWWTWSGVWPAGVLKSSSPSAPPVLSPLALMVMRICRYQIGSPPSLSRAKNSFDISCLLGICGRNPGPAESGGEISRELFERARLASSDPLEVVGREVAPTLGVNAAVVDEVANEPGRQAEAEHRLASRVLGQGDIGHRLAKHLGECRGSVRHTDRLGPSRRVRLARVPLRLLDDAGGERPTSRPSIVSTRPSPKFMYSIPRTRQSSPS